MSQPHFIQMKIHGEVKMYVAFKSETVKAPHLICKFHKNSIPVDMSEYGITYFEDEIGWYYKHGELICSSD